MKSVVLVLSFLVAPNLGFHVQPSTISRSRLLSSPEPSEGTVVEEEKKEKVPVAKPGRYDVSKLVSQDDGPGFNQFDPVLSATRFVSRRFGIVGGLSLFAGLALVEGREIVASFRDSSPDAAVDSTTVTLPSGLKYTDVLRGKGGNTPLPGYVIGLKAVVKIGDTEIYNTKDEKPLAFKYGTRPFQNVLCEGVEQGIQGMRVGGKRVIQVPANLAPPGVQLPPGVPLVYEVELTEVLSGYF